MNGFQDRDFFAPRNDHLLPVAVEVAIPVIVTAAMAAAVIGNAQDAVYCAHRAADTGTDDAADRAASGPAIRLPS